jgi:photosystem II stability/assembly factor-like uncharacterized protein
MMHTSKAPVFLLLLSFTGFSQNYKEMMQDPSYNFYEVVREAESYFENNPKGKGTGYTPFQRWKYENEPHYYPSGVRNQSSHFIAEKAFEDFIAKNPGSAARAGLNPWTELGPWKVENITGHYAPGMGRVETFFIDRVNLNRMFLGSRSGGFWRSYDGGAHWENTTDQLPASGVNSIAVSPNDSNLILINVQNSSNGRTHGIYMSTDDGTTWSPTEFSSKNGLGGLGTNLTVYKLSYHPTIPNLMFVASSQGIYRSIDTLNTWVQVTTNSTRDMAFHPTNDSVVYAWESSQRDKLAVSSDFGNTFGYSATMLGQNSGGTTIAVSDDCPECVYVGSGNGIWKSADRGATFSFISNPSGGGNHLVVSDEDSDVMIAGGVDAYSSTDGGLNFNQVTWWSLGSVPFDGDQYIHADLRESACYDGIFYLATDGYLARSSDDGDSWEIISEEIGIRENYSLGQSQSHRQVSYCGSQDNGQSLVNDTAWLEIYGADGMEGVIQPLNPNILMGSWQFGGRRRSFDGGISGQVCTPFDQDDGLWVAPLLLDPVNQFRVYSMDETLFASDDFGSSWDDLGTPFGTGAINQAVIGENNPNYMFFSDGGDLAKTSDGGQNYKSLTQPVNHFVTDIAMAPGNDSIVVIVNDQWQNNGGKIFVSRDFGESWGNHTYNLGDMPLRSVIIDHTDDMNIYVGAEIGLYFKGLKDSIWTLFNENLPNVSIRDIKIHRGSNTLRAVSWGRGLFEVKLPGREDFPSIERVYMTQPNSLSQPKKGVDNYIYAEIDYAGTLSSVNLSWGENHLNLDTTEAMVLQSGNLYRSAEPMPDLAIDSDLHFRITSTGDQGDKSESYRFMYSIHPFVYCDAVGGSGTGGDYIDYVELNGVGQASGKEGYADFTNVEIPLIRGLSYSLEITLNFHWDPDTTAAWIDFNQDSEFSSDELIEMTELNAQHESFAFFTVPTDAKTGSTRMRVRNQYYNEAPDPCATRVGEVEDYTVVIGPPQSLEEQNASMEVKVVPNPAKGSFQLICCEGEVQAVVLQDIHGKTVRVWNGSRGDYSLEGLSSGLYVVRVESKGYNSSVKLLVE